MDLTNLLNNGIARTFPYWQVKRPKCGRESQSPRPKPITNITHRVDDDGVGGAAREHEAQALGPLDQRPLVGGGGLVDEGLLVPLWDHRVAHRHHGQELTDLRGGGLDAHTRTNTNQNGCMPIS